MNPRTVAQRNHLNEKCFLFISDIHFMKRLGESNFDLDLSLRHGLEQDVQRLLPEVGHVDGVLVAGDIAFAGKVAEYEMARAWLDRLAASLQCDNSLVWCVPGNHDIDQDVHKELPLLYNSHDALRGSTKLNDDLKAQLDDSKENGNLLFLPLKNYNQHFGSKYDCPTSPKKPWWEDELELNDGSILRIRGLNSAFISSRKDRRDTARLIVGSAQTQFLPEDRVVQMTMCHHPPDWLVDEEDIHAALTAHSHVQLLGHKHRHRVETINNTLRLYSGAVQPARAEQQWDPRYYFLTLGVNTNHTEKTRTLYVRLFARVWDNTGREFVKEQGNYEGLYTTTSIQLPYWKAPATARADVGATATPSATSMSLNRKKLVHRFTNLPFSTQMAIMGRFNLFTEDERDALTDVELFATCFQRARERNQIEQVWDAIEAAEKTVEG